MKLTYPLRSVTVQMGRTALYIATQRGQTSIVEMLVDKFHANVSSRSNDGSTLMHVAAQCGNAETAMAMYKKGVPLNMPNKVRWSSSGLHSLVFYDVLFENLTLKVSLTFFRQTE